MGRVPSANAADAPAPPERFGRLSIAGNLCPRALILPAKYLGARPIVLSPRAASPQAIATKGIARAILFVLFRILAATAIRARRKIKSPNPIPKGGIIRLQPN